MIQNMMVSRRFMPLFLCQFFAALNDNFVKAALVFLILFSADIAQAPALVSAAGAVFIIPYFILSGLGGQIADKFEKAMVARRLKLGEIVVALIAAVGFAMNSVALLMLALASTGALSALFSPVKYSILPEQLEVHELTAGNAMFEGATFAAILLGAAVGGVFSAAAEPWMVSAAMVLVALASFIFACLIPQSATSTPSLSIDRNPIVSTWRVIREFRKTRQLWAGGLIVSWFWLVGTVVLSILPSAAKEVLGGDQDLVSACLALFVIGIAAGSLLAAKASHLRPNLGVVPLAALAMGAFSVDLAWTLSDAPAGMAVAVGDLATTAYGARLAIDLVGLAMCGGLFVVPSFAAVQSWAAPGERARVIAAVNIISAAFMGVAGLSVAGAQASGVGFYTLLMLLGAGNLIAALVVLKAWGHDVVRELGVVVFRTLFRVKVKGLENLPAPGAPMVIAPNHVSLIDGPLLRSFLPIDPTFAVHAGWANKWWMRLILAGLPHQPVDFSEPSTAMRLVRIVKSGEPLVIFPEGRITVTGQMMKVYDGVAMIAEKTGAAVVPVRIEGAERSPLSYLRQGQVRKALLPRITLTIEPPMQLSAQVAAEGKQGRKTATRLLQDAMTETATRSMIGDKTLFEALTNAMKTRSTGKPILEDAMETQLSYPQLIRAAQVLGGKLEPMTAERENVGVMLPNAAGAAVAFFALQSIARVPAMLNFTAGADSIASCCRAAEVKTILTSRAFVDAAKLEAIVERLSARRRIVYLEDVKAGVTFADKLRGVMQGRKARVAQNPDDPAVILFTSGSEGAPKGVVLSHRNILANVGQSLARVDVNGEDKVFNVLPVFHSFGLTAGLLMPLFAGVPVFLYPSPLHYRIVPELIYQTNATILFGTNTFLAGYARTAHAYDFRSLRLVLAGAEPVRADTRAVFMERFGVRILEGYGVTEAAPVLALNTPLENRAGTVGRLSPMMEARLEAVDGVTEGGRLHVRGPNIMLGYLRDDNPGVLVPPPDGWHDTGDIVSIDADGFITIRGRAKRFAKLGGEMVSLAAVEALAHEIWPEADTAAAAVADKRRGERIVLVTTARAADRDQVLQQVKRQGASELLVPAEVRVVDELPLLGSGKTDHRAVKALIEDRQK